MYYSKYLKVCENTTSLSINYFTHGLILIFFHNEALGDCLCEKKIIDTNLIQLSQLEDG